MYKFILKFSFKIIQNELKNVKFPLQATSIALK